MPLFTFIMQYEGGSYSAQVEASSWEEAPFNWGRHISNDPDVLHQLGPKALDELACQLVDPDFGPTALTGLTNIWCIAWCFNEKLALINFVQTTQD